MCVDILATVISLCLLSKWLWLWVMQGFYFCGALFVSASWGEDCALDSAVCGPNSFFLCWHSQACIFICVFVVVGDLLWENLLSWCRVAWGQLLEGRIVHWTRQSADWVGDSGVFAGIAHCAEAMPWQSGHSGHPVPNKTNQGIAGALECLMSPRLNKTMEVGGGRGVRANFKETVTSPKNRKLF